MQAPVHKGFCRLKPNMILIHLTIIKLSAKQFQLHAPDTQPAGCVYLAATQTEQLMSISKCLCNTRNSIQAACQSVAHARCFEQQILFAAWKHRNTHCYHTICAASHSLCRLHMANSIE